MLASRPRTTPLLTRIAACWFGLVVLGFLAYAGHVAYDLGGSSSDRLFDNVGYNAAMLGAAIALILRAATRRRDRAAMLLLAAGLTSWALGDLTYTLLYGGGEAPYPSVSDALYLTFFPLCYAGLGMLIRARFRGVSAAAWLDGLIAGLGLGAVAAGVLLDPILANTGASVAEVATNLAYPVGDLLMFLVVVTAVGLTGWRPEAMWALIALSLIVSVVADTTYLFQVANNTYVEGSWVEPLWPLSGLLLVLALWMPSRPVARPPVEGWRALVVPGAGVSAATTLLFVDHGSVAINTPARLLAAATLVVAVVRISLAFRRSRRMHEQSRSQAVTDALTGLGNRRILIEDLDETIELAGQGDPRLLILFDLNGFKHYNDSFGHPAGDALLARLGGNLEATVAPYGRAYRMGGDEFCALLRPAGAPAEALAAAASAALSETGHGFEIDSAYGMALLPFDADSASEALALADRRLYSNKESRPLGVKRQLRGVLLQVLGEREPALLSHLDGVAALALRLGRHLHLDAEALDVLVRGAEMHDIGKMAIPETILNKPGPLAPEELVFMRRHTILGERILSAAPALQPVAELVRSSHERWDGAGYPDGLAGERIPLGSRIIFVCDAYDAMTAVRPYSPARPPQEALDELARCSGSQFDPDIVDALKAVLTARERATPGGGRELAEFRSS